MSKVHVFRLEYGSISLESQRKVVMPLQRQRSVDSYYLLLWRWELLKLGAQSSMQMWEQRVQHSSVSPVWKAKLTTSSRVIILSCSVCETAAMILRELQHRSSMNSLVITIINGTIHNRIKMTIKFGNRSKLPVVLARRLTYSMKMKNNHSGGAVNKVSGTGFVTACMAYSTV